MGDEEGIDKSFVQLEMGWNEIGAPEEWRAEVVNIESDGRIRRPVSVVQRHAAPRAIVLAVDDGAAMVELTPAQAHGIAVGLAQAAFRALELTAAKTEGDRDG